MAHIRATLPDIKARISQQLQKFNAELQTLGGAFGDTSSSSIVLNVITEFCSEFRTTIDGNTNDLSLNELSGGARISFVFHELFNNGIKTIDPFDQVKDGDIRTILYNSSGSTPSLFVGTQAFEIIVKQQIRRLEDPSLKCCQLVYDELIRILSQLLQKIVGSPVICHCTLFTNTHPASVQAIPCPEGPLQLCGRQLLQERHEPYHEAGL